ncbi:MAG: endonuclease/exonuclease/phosphatase family protein [Patescibacteria group bacterium]
MRILTANIALGLANSDRLMNNLRGIAAYHTWFALIGIIFSPLRGSGEGPAHSERRTDYLHKHRDLEPLFRMIQDTGADIVVLNEVIPEIHEPELESRLRSMGFKTITSGQGTKYPDAHISTYIAAKETGKAIPAHMPQLARPGCGSGVACLRLDNGISVIGAHTAFGGSELWTRQIEALAALAKAEQEHGQQIILAGDWNETQGPILSLPDIQKLGVIPVDPDETPTCPISLPRFLQRQLDHILVPEAWRVVDLDTIAFGSDHLAVCAEVAGTSGLNP